MLLGTATKNAAFAFWLFNYLHGKTGLVHHSQQLKPNIQGLSPIIGRLSTGQNYQHKII